MTITNRLKNVSDEDVKKAQVRLNELCEQHNLKPWSIRSGDSEWLELGLRMAGIPYDKKDHISSSKGRPSTWDSTELQKDIIETIDIYRGFYELDKNGDPIKGSAKLDKVFEYIVKAYNIQDYKTDSRKTTIPAKKRVKTLWNNRKEEFFKLLKEDMEEYMKNYDSTHD